MLKAFRFVSLVLTALSLGGAFAHVLELPNKRVLDYEDYLFVQQRLYEGWGRVIGSVELGALLSTIAVFVLVRGSRASSIWTFSGVALISTALIVWQVWVGPVNVQVSDWNSASTPENWMQLRDSWEYGHAARAVLFAGAFISLLVPALSDASPGRKS